jgi:hypothetical protein
MVSEVSGQELKTNFSRVAWRLILSKLLPIVQEWKLGSHRCSPVTSTELSYKMLCLAEEVSCDVLCCGPGCFLACLRCLPFWLCLLISIVLGDTNYHIGNHRFRVLADEHRQRYRSASRKEKAIVVQEVVKSWRSKEPPGTLLLASRSPLNGAG